MAINDCIFCKIGRGEIPAHVVYEDDRSIAFLDLHPINPGHVLVIPRVHEPELHRLESGLYTHIASVVQKISLQVSDKIAPKKVGILVAGWDVPHAHVHVVPMNEPHDLTSEKILRGSRGNPAHAELVEISRLLRGAQK